MLSLKSVGGMRPPHRVFINFRGDEIRNGFLSHLEEALEMRRINFFTDKHEPRGRDLSSLMGRIKESRVAVAILSKRYAESEWCLDELVKIMKRVEKSKLQVIPVFYKVEAEDVRRQTGEFGDKFWELAKTCPGKIKKWTDALYSVTDKMGLTLRNDGNEREFKKEIVSEVERVLNEIHPLTRKKRNKASEFLMEESKWICEFCFTQMISSSKKLCCSSSPP